MSNVIQLPVEKYYPREIRGKEIWAQKDPPDDMVWAICPYIRSGLQSCKHCPRTYHDEDYGQMVHGCYGLAAEACRIVFASQARQKKRWWKFWQWTVKYESKNR